MRCNGDKKKFQHTWTDTMQIKPVYEKQIQIRSLVKMKHTARDDFVKIH